MIPTVSLMMTGPPWTSGVPLSMVVDRKHVWLCCTMTLNLCSHKLVEFLPISRSTTCFPCWISHWSLDFTSLKACSAAILPGPSVLRNFSCSLFFSFRSLVIEASFHQTSLVCFSKTKNIYRRCVYLCFKLLPRSTNVNVIKCISECFMYFRILQFGNIDALWHFHPLLSPSSWYTSSACHVQVCGLYHILPYALLSQYKHLGGLAFEWWYNPRCVHALILDVSMLPCTWPFADRKYCTLLNQTLCTVTEVKDRYYSSCLYHVVLVHSSFHDRFRNMHWNLQVVKSYLHSVSK